MTRFATVTRTALLSFFLAGTALFAYADELPVVRGEVYVGTAKAAEPAGLLTTDDELPATWLRLSAPSKARLEAMSDTSTGAKRREIGFGREVAADAVEGGVSSLQWLRAGSVRIAKLRVVSPGAKAMRVGLTFTGSNAVAEVRVAGSFDESRTVGPARFGGLIVNKEVFWTPVTEGETQVIEIAIAADAIVPTISVPRVSHLVAGPSDRFKRVSEIGQSGSCEIDVACVTNPSQALLNAARSVVQIVFTRLGGGTALCTGTILNDTDPATQIPYLYTGNHCFDSESPSGPFNSPTQMQQIANTLNSYFFFDAATCGSLAVPAFVQRFGGATYLYNNTSQDVLFLRLNDTLPSGAVLSGWDPNTIAAGTNMVVLHHPQGDLKKYTAGSISGTTVLSAPISAPTGFWRATYTNGSTEGGSSGAPLFVFSGGEYLLKGGLWGGEALCTALTAPDWYSRFDVAYPALAPFLSKAAPLYNVSDLWADPNEDGQGMTLIQHANGQLFTVWYTYTTGNKATWIAMPGGTWVTATSFVGDLYIVSANSQVGAFSAAATSNRRVGTGTLTFSSANTGSFTWTIDGVTVSKIFQRIAF